MVALAAGCTGGDYRAGAPAARELALLATEDLDGPQRPSGLAFAEGRLYAVGDRSATVHVLTADGETVDEVRIALPPEESAGIEGIAVTRDYLHLALEPTGEIVTARADDGVVSGRIKVEGAVDGDSGLEGVAEAPRAGSALLMAVKEENPSRLYEVGTGGALSEVPIAAVQDVSGLAPFCDGNLLAVSQEGAAIYLLAMDGQLLASWPVPSRDAEGIAFDGSGRVYVVDEESRALFVYGVSPPCGAAGSTR